MGRAERVFSSVALLAFLVGLAVYVTVDHLPQKPFWGIFVLVNLVCTTGAWVARLRAESRASERARAATFGVASSEPTS